MISSPNNRIVIAVFLLVVLGTYLWRGQWRRLAVWLALLTAGYTVMLSLRPFVNPGVLVLTSMVLFTLPLFDGVWLLLYGRLLFFPGNLRLERSSINPDNRASGSVHKGSTRRGNS